jgi:hypothetical protein
MSQKIDRAYHEKSVEKQRDLSVANSAAQLNQEMKETSKKLSSENKKMCKAFWEEQMKLHKKHKEL